MGVSISKDLRYKQLDSVTPEEMGRTRIAGELNAPHQFEARSCNRRARMRRWRSQRERDWLSQTEQCSGMPFGPVWKQQRERGSGLCPGLISFRPREYFEEGLILQPSRSLCAPCLKLPLRHDAVGIQKEEKQDDAGTFNI